MARFVYISGIGIVNVDYIKDFYTDREGNTCINYNNGDHRTVRYETYDIDSDIKGKTHIVQVIPPLLHNEQLYDLTFPTEDGESYIATKVDILALCADGQIRSFFLERESGYFEMCESASNYQGMYTLSSLKELPYFDRIEFDET